MMNSKLIRRLIQSLGLALLMFTGLTATTVITGCQDDAGDDMEEAGDNIGDAMEDMGDAAEEATD